MTNETIDPKSDSDESEANAEELEANAEELEANAEELEAKSEELEANAEPTEVTPEESDITSEEQDAPSEEEVPVALTSDQEKRRPKTWLELPRRTVVSLISAFTVVELSGVVFGIPFQLGLTAFAAFLCVNLAIFGYRTNRTAGAVMTTVFTSRLVALTLPAMDISIPTRVGIVGLTVIFISYLSTWVLSIDLKSGRFDEGYPLKTPFVSKRVTSTLTALAGLPIGLVAWLITKPDPLALQPLLGSEFVALVGAIGLLCIAALSEELLYRRLVAVMVQNTGDSQSPVPSAALYSSAFIGSLNPLMIALAFLAGILWSWSCERTGSIKPTVISHIIVVLLVFVVLP